MAGDSDGDGDGDSDDDVPNSIFIIIFINKSN